jgi:alkylhydroperoxidase/carboxymuconolactone decarboxylase family protein YurZ
MHPFEFFAKEFPQLAEQFDQLVNAPRELPGFDAKTKQLINIAIQTAIRNPRGVGFHAAMARRGGASRQETLGAVAVNLHRCGLAAVLESLSAAVEGYDSSV